MMVEESKKNTNNKNAMSEVLLELMVEECRLRMN